MVYLTPSSSGGAVMVNLTSMPFIWGQKGGGHIQDKQHSGQNNRREERGSYNQSALIDKEGWGRVG